MVKKTVTIALAALVLSSVAVFVGVFFGVRRKSSADGQIYLKAAVAADAGPCSEIGRWDREKDKTNAIKNS